MSVSFLQYLISVTLSCSILIILLIAIRPLVHKWLNAKIAYILWVTLPALLVISYIWHGNATLTTSQIFFADFESHKSVSKLIARTASNSDFQWAIHVWFGGVILMISCYIWQYQRLLKSLSLMTQPVASAAEFKIDKRVVIVNSSLIDVPAVFGGIRAYLILPVNFLEFTQVNQRLILAHEAFHLARGDHRVNLFRNLFKSLFWFNPLVHLADKFVEADQEISCDLGVLSAASKAHKKRYASLLVASATGQSKPYLVSHWKFQSLVKERVKMLKNQEQRKWHGWVAGAIAAISIWATSGLVVASKYIEEAQVVEIVNPKYPRGAVKQSIEGQVEFELTIDAQGEVTNAIVVHSEPKGIFDTEASKAIKQWKFVKNASGKYAYTMQFKLGE